MVPEWDLALQTSVVHTSHIIKHLKACLMSAETYQFISHNGTTLLPCRHKP